MLFKEIAFRVQFNVEFPRQVMNFPIKSPLSKGTLMPETFGITTTGLTHSLRLSTHGSIISHSTSCSSFHLTFSLNSP